MAMLAPQVPIAPAGQAPQPVGTRQALARPQVPSIDTQGEGHRNDAITGEARAPRPAPGRSAWHWPIFAGLAGLLGLGLWLGLSL